MKLKVKSKTSHGYHRTEHSVDIKEVMINEDFMHPDNETIAIGFRNKDTSGLIEMTAKEFDKFTNSVKRKLHLIKSVKSFGRDGAVNFNK